MRLVLAAMGPKMCAFAGAEFDGVFFNWMTPAFAASAREHVTRRRRRRRPRATAGPGLRADRRRRATPAQRLAKEEAFYRDLHAGYRNHFDRLGEPEGTVGVAAADRDGRTDRPWPRYEALDVTVVRGLASANAEAMIAVAEAAAP